MLFETLDAALAQATEPDVVYVLPRAGVAVVRLGWPCRVCGRRFSTPRGRGVHQTRTHGRQEGR